MAVAPSTALTQSSNLNPKPVIAFEEEINSLADALNGLSTNDTVKPIRRPRGEPTGKY
jgi:hypothetical protein